MKYESILYHTMVKRLLKIHLHIFEDTMLCNKQAHNQLLISSTWNGQRIPKPEELDA